MRNTQVGRCSTILDDDDDKALTVVTRCRGRDVRRSIYIYIYIYIYDRVQLTTELIDKWNA